jgi:formylglycine-generating enzyme required for sulfatase activity
MKLQTHIALIVLVLILSMTQQATAQKQTYAQAIDNPTTKLKAKKVPAGKSEAKEWTAQSVAESIEMVRIEGGAFLMGSNDGVDDAAKPVHTVQVSTFAIGKYEITQAQWKAVMHKNPSHFSNCDNCPVENVSWNDLQEFIKKLNEQTGQHFRLPTEAEWEYAAKGGNKSNYYQYSGGNSISLVSWYGLNSGNRTHPVGKKNANELGIFDMSGNVMEWCEDWYDPAYYKKSPYENPTGPNSGKLKVIRGGSWVFREHYSSTTYRSCMTPDYRSNFFGFRLVKD